MHIRYGYKIEVVCEQSIPLITMLDIHPGRRSDVTQPDDMVAIAIANDCAVDTSEIYQDQFGNICRRVMAPAGGVILEAEGIVHDSGFVDVQHPGAMDLPPEELPSETLVFLLGSRYCETDRLASHSWAMFGGIVGGWEKVQAVCDYVHHHIRFDYGLARNTRTAAEAFEERVGVCRDFAHLAITLCRGLNLPARYCTGYLGDIGVEVDPNPMDFSAWFEVFLDGQWMTFDARHNAPRIGRILIAQGRDATDVPIINSFGSHYLRRFDVITEEVTGARYPVSAHIRRDHWSQHGTFGEES